MSLWDGIKNIMNVSDDEFDEETEEVETPAEEPVKKTEFFSKQPKESKSKTVPFSSGNMEVVLFKPISFSEVTAIADSYCQRKTVILNLESTDRENIRRIIDFLSGVAYAKRGNLKQVANNTFVIAPCDVDITGELFADDFGDSSRYYH